MNTKGRKSGLKENGVYRKSGLHLTFVSPIAYGN
jgi:hypothetical protein